MLKVFKESFLMAFYNYLSMGNLLINEVLHINDFLRRALMSKSTIPVKGETQFKPCWSGIHYEFDSYVFNCVVFKNDFSNE